MKLATKLRVLEWKSETPKLISGVFQICPTAGAMFFFVSCWNQSSLSNIFSFREISSSFQEIRVTFISDPLEIRNTYSSFSAALKVDSTKISTVK